MPLPSSQISALRDLYDSCGGLEWRWFGHGTHWTFSNNNSDPCLNGWEGISCWCNNTETFDYHPYSPYYAYYDDDGSNFNDTRMCTVEKLYLMGHNLHGTIPNSISQLINLSKLHLGKNNIEGSLESISSLDSLILLKATCFKDDQSRRKQLVVTATVFPWIF
jgi:hypothetical protein